MSTEASPTAAPPAAPLGSPGKARHRHAAQKAAHLKDAARDRRVEFALGALAAGTLALIAAMLVTVMVNGWPSFAANGLGWFGNSGDPVTQFRAMQTGTALPGHSLLYFSAWPLVWGTALCTAGAVAISVVVSTLAAIFLTEFAPTPVRRVLEPVVRLLAGVPSVIYGLVGLLLLAPWVNGLIRPGARNRSSMWCS